MRKLLYTLRLENQISDEVFHLLMDKLDISKQRAYKS
mgnify:CR=1 FL=1|jgi:hypothetical protein